MICGKPVTLTLTFGVHRGSIDTKMLAIARDASMPGSDQAQAPISRLGKPEEVARLCAFLLSDDASYTTGAIYTIDGGMTP